MVAQNRSKRRHQTPERSHGLRNSSCLLARTRRRTESLPLQASDANSPRSRPKSLDDVAAQDHTVTVLQRTLQASNVSVGFLSLPTFAPGPLLTNSG